MNNITVTDKIEYDDLHQMTLEELHHEAAKYGRVRTHASEFKEHPSRYRCIIEFETSPGSKIEAASEFDLTVEEAHIGAIEIARDIVKSIKGLVE